MKYFITFGSNHNHPETGDCLRDYWIEIEAKDNTDIHYKALKRFGHMWSQYYREDNFDPKFFPKGNYELVKNKISLDERFERKVKGIL